MGVEGCCITGCVAGLWPGYGGGACCPGGPRIPICNGKAMERWHLGELQGWFTPCLTASSHSRTLVITKGVRDFPRRQPPPGSLTC